MTPSTPTRAEREAAIWAAYHRALADARDVYCRANTDAWTAHYDTIRPAGEAFDRALANAQTARDAALEALKEEGQ